MELFRSYQQARAAVQREEGTGYPGKALVRMELEPGFERAKTKLLPHIRCINEAHLIMLAEQGIVSQGNASRIMGALQAIDYDAYARSSYSGAFEDLYFQLEDEIIRRTDGIGGNLHLARSRNDMCVAWSHMVIRDELLALTGQLVRARNTAVLFAQEHQDTLYVVHTHTQHAQPGLLGHYFLGVADVLGRNILRFQQAYRAVNASPMGAAAITTTGFPISRQRVAELAGFDTVIHNAYDAIGNCDYLTQSAAAVGLCALDLGRVVTDMVAWATEEMKMIRLADGYISTSSIMPQKRNPIALEHLRASLAVVKGHADTVALGFLKTPYGDISDYEDIEDSLSQAIRLLGDNLALLNAVVATLDVDRELLARRAHESFSVVTEMADQMVRAYGIPFRQAHHFVAFLVKKANAQAYDLRYVTPDFFARAYEEFFGQPFTQDFEPIAHSVDPWFFVRSREVYGGTGPQAMGQMLEEAWMGLKEEAAWCTAAREALAAARDKRMTAVRQLLEKA